MLDTPRDASPAVRQYADFHKMIDYLRRDWSRMPESEEEVALTEKVLFQSIQEHATDRESALVLGAGLGRYAWDLQPMFGRVFALELSFLMAGTFLRLLQQPLVLYEINEANVRSVEDQAIQFQAALPQPDGTGGLPYYVADAAAVPLPDESVSAVVSVYFTDVVPLSRFLPEVRRVLRPGRIFIHFGPLGYHFDEPEEKRAADELREAFEQAGFAFCSEAWTPSFFLRTASRMSALWFDTWSFTARKTSGGPAAAIIGEEVVLAFQGPQKMELTVCFTEDAEQSFVEAWMRTATGDALSLDELTTRFLGLVDGTRSIGEILTALSAECPISPADRSALFGTLRRLLEGGVLKVASGSSGP